LKDWLQRKTDFKWLMILDNADDPTIFRDAQDLGESSQLQADLSLYIPDCEHGSVLITTRDLIVGRRLANGMSPLQINKMSREEAVTMLKTRLSTRGEASPITSATPASYQQPVSDTDLLRLAQSLDYLPLAMVQAAGFITENGISIGRYMKLFEDDASAVQLLKHNVEESGRDSDIPSSVYATWKLSIEQIQKAYPKSAGLIFLMAHYEQLQIPTPLLKHHVGHDVVEFTIIIGVLLRFSLIVGGRDATYNMHRLVQLIVKQWLAASGAAAEWQSKALRLLSSHFPSGEFETWMVCASLESHAVKMTHTPAIKDADRSLLGTLQINLAWYYSNRGRWSSAEEYARAACITFQETYGLRHRETLAAKTKFAYILKQNSKLEEAEVVIKQTVHESKALLGSKDRQYFDALDLFALIAQTRGRLIVAEKASRKALSGCKKVLEPHHPSVFRSQRRLATILEFSGRYDQAETCIMSALNGRKHLIGTADKITLQVMQRLVFIQRAQGKYVEAEKTAGEYLKVTTATYGPNHIDTQEARYTFAFSLIANSKIEEAETIFLSLIEFIEKEHPFGPDHQYNFYIQNALSSIRMIQGRYVEASRLQSTAWNGIQKTYGKHHAKTYEYQSAYAAALTLADALELDGAMILQQQAYDGLKIVVGKEHPSTLTALLRLSEAHATKRELGCALKLAEKALRGREKMLNVNHPDTLAARKRVIELRTMQQGTMGANIDLDKTDSGSSEKKQKKKRSFFGLRSRASSNATPVETGSHADGASTEKKKTAHVAAEELEKTDSYDSIKGKRKSSLGLFGRYLYGDTDQKIEDKEIELNIESDSDDDGTGENLDNEKSAAFTNNPLRPPPLPPRPALDTQSDATNARQQGTRPQHSASIEIPSQTVQQEDTIESTMQQIRRKPIASRPSSYHEQRKPESKPDASELPAERIINPAARLDGPGWDASPFGA
jgi:tetratricopeptide (TPR) repeat protein